MKRALKGAEPAKLARFRKAHPRGKWDDVRRNRPTYRACRDQALSDQRNLCAYCEKRIDSHDYCRVEHFHPKSDKSTAHNWHLDWNNMLAVCDGGEGEPDKVSNPLPENLSCDSHKNHLIHDPTSAKELIYDTEKNLLNPLDLPAFPNLYIFDKATGYLWPDASACREAGVNACKLLRSIYILNLNCKRLARARLNVFAALEEMLDFLDGKPFPAPLLRDYLGGEYFTTYRCCLGQAAEKYLRSIHYNG